MYEVIADIRRWRADASEDSVRNVALATVVSTWGSAPRRIGSKMAITDDGRMAGSVSGGCVEGAVAEVALDVFQSSRPALLHFGVADETAWSVGLACGGSIEIFVEALDDALFSVVDRMLSEEQAGAAATVINGPKPLLGRRLFVDHHGECIGTIDTELDKQVYQEAIAAFNQGEPRRMTLDEFGVDLFIDVLMPPPTLIMVGGVHIAVALTSLARTLGYRTVVIDPRPAFGSEERFPDVDHLVAAWPQDALPQLTINENTAVALLTHDPKLDDPAFEIVLNSPAFYVGALGSRKTHAVRINRLGTLGLTPAQIERIRGPIGLNIGAQTPEEIALSIMAEIIAERHQYRE